MKKKEIKPFKCPNCGQKMYLEEKEIVFQEDKHDKWACHDCMHILVLDFRSDN